MRLLRTEADGGLSLVEYIGNDIPPYAILSHTWGPDQDEVSFRDLTEGEGKGKVGHRKLTFCAKRAALDHLLFFWIDTCCIDKSSSSELQEAINSMYRWYNKAEKCYAYLSDVSISGARNEEIRSGMSSEPTWAQAFQDSRWFTRGWTLQELLAPKCIEFFSVEGEQLGDRSSLLYEIHRITRIPLQALQGSPLRLINVEERLSWAKKRQTKREEDAAYSLLGIFDIHMPLIYGEGQENAFGRLRRKINKSSNNLSQQIQRQKHTLNILDIKIGQIIRQMNNRPRELGFSWEGAPEGQLKIDDGLNAEYLLPVDLCKTPEAFFGLLKFRFESRKLPGSQQIQQGHFLIWEWNERHPVTHESWSSVVEDDRAVKISFVMGNWFGPPRGRCMRCFKPRASSGSRLSFKHCYSCKLAVRWVEPDYFPFEPDDIVIFDRDTYRDYQLESRRPKLQDNSCTSGTSATPILENHDDDVPPSIDLVCHRLTMKWEPIYNEVYRYLFCRCIIRLSTPSRIIDESTYLLDYTCPRHNKQGVTFQDYSELALPCYEDPYFDQFGGYYGFWALLHCHLPWLYDHLGGHTYITGSQLDCGYVNLERLEKSDKNAVRRILRDYRFEVTEVMVNQGLNLPPESAEFFAKEKARSKEENQGNKKFSFGFDEKEISYLRKQFAESAMGRELSEIVTGNWGGIPHWTIED